MKRLASVRWRVFLIVWLVYAVHFATNVVREHYPAFSLVEQGSFRVDAYQGFHSDIFVHRDGHSYVANNVAVSVIAAVPLLVFDPVLDALERYSRGRLASGGVLDTTYRTDKPNRRDFWRKVQERGLELRFGAATFVTSVFLTAPLSALAVVLLYHILTLRGVAEKRAAGLAFLFAFGTPLFFRQVPLYPNLFVMFGAFGAFYLLWGPPRGGGAPAPVSAGRRFAAGALAGFCLAADYSGVVPLGVLYLYLVWRRRASASWRQAIGESFVFVAGAVPPILFLVYSQWAMFGDPFLPAQYWMPAVNFTDQGWRGFAWPAPDLFLRNLFDPRYGMYTFGPLLLVGLLPTRAYPAGDLVLPRPERRLAAGLFLALLVFCAANQYSRMQFNTGFRYLAPLLPFVFLQASDHLLRMPRRWLLGLSAVAIAHSWVLAAVRESVPDSWRLVLSEGIQLPWLTVLRRTAPPDTPVLGSPLLPIAILGITLVCAWALWRTGERLSRAAAVPSVRA